MHFQKALSPDLKEFPIVIILETPFGWTLIH